jgi:bifunctional ADP-heptose synthase (sugar kinase/adenylyltransferase)
MTTIVAEDDCTIKTMAPNAGVTMIQVVTEDTVVGGTDNVTVDLSRYGCTNVHAVLVFDETTKGSVVVNEAPTATSVSSSVLTVDLGGSDTGVKTILIWAY